MRPRERVTQDDWLTMMPEQRLRVLQRARVVVTDDDQAVCVIGGRGRDGPTVPREDEAMTYDGGRSLV